MKLTEIVEESKLCFRAFLYLLPAHLCILLAVFLFYPDSVLGGVDNFIFTVALTGLSVYWAYSYVLSDLYKEYFRKKRLEKWRTKV